MGGKGAWGKGAEACGKGGKVAAAGKAKGKSKPEKLEKTRITAEKFTGEVTKWQGKFGFIKPAEEIEHEKASLRQGCLYVSVDDIESDPKVLTVGSTCEFH